MMNYELLNAAQSIEQLITSVTRLACRKCHAYRFSYANTIV